MISSAIDSGKLKPGMSIVEGTAGNTGIGLGLVGASMGIPVEIFMPNNQSKMKEQMISLFGAKLNLVAPCPFKDENHFYHQAKNKALAEPEKYWWADQFENTDNHLAHYKYTGPEILKDLPEITHFVSTAGSGGTIAGISRYLKEKKTSVECVLVDPKGSGLKSYIETGIFKSEGSSFTEGIGIMRLVENFKHAKIDRAISLKDDSLVELAHFIKNTEGFALGLSSALNLSAAFAVALKAPPGSQILSLSCDLGERSMAKLYNGDFLSSQDIAIDNETTRLENISQKILSQI